MTRRCRPGYCRWSILPRRPLSGCPTQAAPHGRPGSAPAALSNGQSQQRCAVYTRIFAAANTYTGQTIVEDGVLVFNTGKDTAKGRALARDPRATLCVDLEEPPYGFVQVQGDAEISEDPVELVRTATAIAARYMGQDRAEEFGKRNGVPGELVVRLHPTKVIAALDMTA